MVELVTSLAGKFTMDISELLARVAMRAGTSSGRSLARELDVPASLLDRYSKRLSIPNDDTMLRICAAANVAPERGLLLVNMWRSKGRARAIYARLLKLLPEIEPIEAKTRRKSRTHEEQIHSDNP
jgi:hypothetical protein